jgi:hypothetical protein
MAVGTAVLIATLEVKSVAQGRWWRGKVTSLREAGHDQRTIADGLGQKNA